MGTTTMKTVSKKPFYLQTANPVSHLFFGPYAFFPLIAGLVWLAGLLALMGLWVQDGKPRYSRGNAVVVFISDVGGKHKPLFIGICVVTSAFYILSLLAERWLRHVDRLPVDLRTREKIFDWLAICFCIIGSAGLILLSIFDTFNHSTVHWSMTLVFVVGVALSAIFQSGEIWSLHKDHPDRKSLLRNSIIKLAIVGLAVLCAIAFGATYGICGGDSVATGSKTEAQCSRITSTAGALEWTVAFILVFYFFSLILDLWPAGKSSPRYMRRLARWQEKNGEGHDFTGRGAFEQYPERWQGDAMAREEALATGAVPGQAPIVSAQALEERMRREMWERNNGLEGRSSMASSQAPIMRQTEGVAL